MGAVNLENFISETLTSRRVQTHSAPRNVNKPAILPQIRRLVAESGIPLKKLAGDAKVDYQAFRRFIVGATKDYNATSAELVFYELTGRPFSPPEVPLKRSLRKRRAA